MYAPCDVSSDGLEDSSEREVKGLEIQVCDSIPY